MLIIMCPLRHTSQHGGHVHGILRQLSIKLSQLSCLTGTILPRIATLTRLYSSQMCAINPYRLSFLAHSAGLAKLSYKMPASSAWSSDAMLCPRARTESKESRDSEQPWCRRAAALLMNPLIFRNLHYPAVLTHNPRQHAVKIWKQQHDEPCSPFSLDETASMATSYPSIINAHGSFLHIAGWS